MRTSETTGMQNKTFSIAALEILDTPIEDKESMDRMLKILKQPIYIFNDRVKEVNGKLVLNEKHISDDFFGEGITVQSIVGKNGSGKSSILDLVYRIMNNVGYKASYFQDLNPTKQYNPDNIVKGIEDVKEKYDDEHISFVESLYARIYFTIDEKLCWVECKGNDVNVCLDDEYQINNPFEKKPLRDIMSQLFYSVVTNYSVQSFVSRDYIDEECSSFRDVYDHDKKEVVRVDTSGSNINWLDGVFHKNDGYLTPIVLNPYRYHGNIDMEREEDLTKERLMSLLLWFDDMKKLHILDDYFCEKVEFFFDINSLHQKYVNAEKERAKRQIEQQGVLELDKMQIIKAQVEGETLNLSGTVVNTEDKSLKWKYPEDLARYFYDVTKDEDADSIAKEILIRFGVLDAITWDVKCWAAMYLVYKTLNIAGTYPSYSDYKSLGHLSLFYTKPTEEQKESIRNLVSSILDDESHIATKLKRVLHFIHQELKDEDRLLRPFDFKTYLDVLGNEKNPAFEFFNTQLPPPLFDVEITLNNGQEGTLLTGLSSGERQMIFTTSTFLYHLLNLVSITDERRVQYRNVCMILDEVEICFHPELQKKLLWNLIEMIKSFELNKICRINIIVATHSPFILSDIPQSNILYLEKGKEANEGITISPFGANVNEILSQSFFLSSGFMGEFAARKIRSLIEYLQGQPTNLDNWTEKSAYQVITMVGDEVVRFQLMAMFNKKFGVSDSYKDWLKDEVKRLGLII